MVYNQVTTKDSRFKIWSEKSMFEFFQIEKYPSWIGEKSFYEESVSYDGGKTYQKEEGQIIFGAYFFLGNDLKIQKRIVFNILDLFSAVGGILSIARMVFT